MTSSLRERYAAVLADAPEAAFTEAQLYEYELDLLKAQRDLDACAACRDLSLCPGRGWAYRLHQADSLAARAPRFRETKCTSWVVRQQQLQTQVLVESSRLGNRFRERTLASFAVLPGLRDAFDHCVGWAERFELGVTKSGIVLSGPVGTGKTHLAAGLANALMAQGVPCLFVVVPEFLQELRDAMGRSDSSVGARAAAAKSTPVLFLDDLGKERTEVAEGERRASEWVRETLYTIINRRYEEHLPVVATTNCNIEELRGRLGEATVSRLYEMCDWLRLRGADYRLRGQAKTA